MPTGEEREDTAPEAAAPAVELRRILVMFAGAITGELLAERATEQELGLLVAGAAARGDAASGVRRAP